MKQEYITTSAAKTQAIGVMISQKIHRGVISLSGNLGYGKTTFIQGFAKGLGIPSQIISPTFIMIRTYNIPHKTGRFYHIDLYRAMSEKDIVGLGIPEFLNEHDAILAVEWPDRLGELMPRKRTDITFIYESENKRRIIIEERV